MLHIIPPLVGDMVRPVLSFDADNLVGATAAAALAARFPSYSLLSGTGTKTLSAPTNLAGQTQVFRNVNGGAWSDWTWTSATALPAGSGVEMIMSVWGALNSVSTWYAVAGLSGASAPAGGSVEACLGVRHPNSATPGSDFRIYTKGGVELAAGISMPSAGLIIRLQQVGTLARVKWWTAGAVEPADGWTAPATVPARSSGCINFSAEQANSTSIQEFGRLQVNALWNFYDSPAGGWPMPAELGAG